MIFKSILFNVNKRPSKIYSDAHSFEIGHHLSEFSELSYPHSQLWPIWIDLKSNFQILSMFSRFRKCITGKFGCMNLNLLLINSDFPGFPYSSKFSGCTVIWSPIFFFQSRPTWIDFKSTFQRGWWEWRRSHDIRRILWSDFRNRNRKENGVRLVFLKMCHFQNRELWNICKTIHVIL